MRNMKLGLVGFSLTWATLASADLFKFTDLKGFEKCLEADHIVDTTKTDTGSQSRFVGELEVKERCIAGAASLLAKEKNPEKLKEFIKAARRATDPKNALPLVDLLTAASPKSCNDLETYQLLLDALSGPKSTHGDSYYARARKTVKGCLKDADFKKDFTEEKDAANSYLKDNACEILQQEKIVKACPKG